MWSLAGIALKKIFGQITGSNGLLIILVALLAVILIPNYNFIKEKLGFETKASLGIKLDKEKNKSDTLLDANKNLSEGIDIANKTKDNTVKSIVELNAKDKKTNEKVIDIIKKKDNIIAKIKEKYKTKDDNSENNTVKDDGQNSPTVDLEEEQNLEVSIAQIESIWSTYCGFNVSQQCNSQTG